MNRCCFLKMWLTACRRGVRWSLSLRSSIYWSLMPSPLQMLSMLFNLAASRLLVISKSLDMASVVKSSVSFEIIFQTFVSVLIHLLRIISASVITCSTFLGRMFVSETARSVCSSVVITSSIAFVGILFSMRTSLKFLRYAICSMYLLVVLRSDLSSGPAGESDLSRRTCV